MAESPEIC